MYPSRKRFLAIRSSAALTAAGIFSFAPSVHGQTILFDASKAEMAANADWVLDRGAHNLGVNSTTHQLVAGSGSESNPLRFPSPAQSGITANTLETYWSGALSTWGVTMVKHGNAVESLPYNGSITYGSSTNAQDLSNYKVFVICEPNILFTAIEKTALVKWVNNGGGLYMVSDHGSSDRNSDGDDSIDVWNDLANNNGVSTNPFGVVFNGDSGSPASTNIDTNAADPVTRGPNGNVTQFNYHSGSTLTINPATNSSVKAAVWSTSSHTNSNVMAAYATYGYGRIVAMGDSSPADDGTGDPSDSPLDNGWGEVSDGVLISNGTDWLTNNPVTPTWNVNASGNWSSITSWAGKIPNGAGATAILGKAISSVGTITLDSPRTVGAVQFDNSNRYTISGTAMLTLDSGGAANTVTVVSGSHTIACPVLMNGNTTLNIVSSTSTLLMTGSLTYAAGVTVTKTGAGIARLTTLKCDLLTVSTGTLALSQNGTVNSVKTLSIAGTIDAWSAAVDLGSANLIIDYGGTSPLTTIANEIKNGFSGGSWLGKGIGSSAAAGVPGSHRTMLGFAEASGLGLNKFLGQDVDGTAILIRYTLGGDANLDGVVDATDFTALSNKFGSSGQFWWAGDFNYDGVVNALDFNSLASNFGAPIPSDSIVGLGAIVPEPTLLLTIFASTVAMLGGRRRT